MSYLNEIVDQIRKALEAGPTDGPWRVYEAEGDATAHGISAEHGGAVSWWSEAPEEGINSLEDARFIAACNPANMRILLDALASQPPQQDRQDAERWISMNSVRRPAYGERVIVLTTDADGDPHQVFANWNGEKPGFLGTGGHRVKPVTHWMEPEPLPARAASVKGE